MIDFSFIIPVYNVEKYVDKCIESILNQTYKNFEIILINDGSTDNSGKVCDGYANKDSRVKVLHVKNQGVSSARNKGIKVSSGKYIIFVDSDDYWIGNKLGYIAEKCMYNELDLLAFNYEMYNEKTGNIVSNCSVDFSNALDRTMDGEEFLECMMSSNSLYEWYVWPYVIRRDLLYKNDFKFETGLKYEDVDLMYKIILQSKQIGIMDEVILRYRVNREGSITQNVKLSTEKDKLEVIRNNINYIQSMKISNNVKKILCNNLSCLYYSSLILYNDIDGVNDKKELLVDLKNTMWVCHYTTNRNQKLVYKLIKFIGIKPTCKLLDIRRKIKG